MNQEQQLHLAVREADMSAIKDLLSAGVDIDCLFYGWTPLQVAINQGSEELAILLIDNGCDICKQHDKKDPSPYEGAIRNKLPKVTKALLEKGVDPNMVMTNGNPAIFLAAEKNSLEILQVLLQGKADVNIQNKDGETVLHYASKEGITKMIQLLLESGADINTVCTQDGNKTALIHAVANEHESTVRTLLKHGCDTNLQDSDCWTALWYAYSNSDTEMMELLLKSGANKDVPDSDGRTLLQDAEENEDDDVVALLKRFNCGWTVS